MCIPSPSPGSTATPFDDEPSEVPIAEHLDAVRPHHRFKLVSFGGKPWDLTHLEPFAFRVDPGLGFEITVVVSFSSHCFTKSLRRDGRAPRDIPADELFDDGREVRLLCEERLLLSQRHLLPIIRKLRHRTIQIARDEPQNFVTTESIRDAEANPGHYVVFFVVFPDLKRRRRCLLQVQSAYMTDLLGQRLRSRRKVSLQTILKAASLRRAVRP